MGFFSFLFGSRNNCYKMVLRLAPKYVELRTIYNLIKPKILELYNDNKIDDYTYGIFKKIDENLSKFDEKLTVIYNLAIEDKSEIDEEKIDMIIKGINGMVSIISHFLPMII